MLPNFRKFLHWYLFCSKIFALFSNGTIFVSNFSHFAQMVPCLGFQKFSHYSNGTFCVAEFWNFFKMVPFFCDFWYFSLMVPFLLPNFRKFLNWYLSVPKFSHFSQMVPFCSRFSHFAQIGSTVFKATFCIGTFWRQKVKRGLHFWGV